MIRSDEALRPASQCSEINTDIFLRDHTGRPNFDEFLRIKQNVSQPQLLPDPP